MDEHGMRSCAADCSASSGVTHGTCFVVAMLGPGGAERAIAGIAAHRAKRERVVVITVGSARGDTFSLDPALRRIALNQLGRSDNVIAAIRRNFTRARMLRRAVVECGCDTVVSFVDQTNVLTLIALAGLGIPIIVAERVDPRFHTIKWPWRLIRRLSYRWARAVVVQTAGAAQWARTVVPEGRVVVIANGVDKRTESNTLREPLVMGAGRLVEQKGFDILLRAFALTSTQHPDWRLLIVGEGPERPRLERLAGDLGIADRVQLPGTVSDAEMPYARAGIFALSSRYEGFPNVLLEAMAAGCAVVASRCKSGPEEIIRDGVDGLLVQSGDVALLAAALDLLQRDPATRSRLATAARDVTVRFGREAEMSRWDQLIAGTPPTSGAAND